MNDFLAVPPKTVLERELTNPASPARAALTATYVTYVDSVTGLPLVAKHVIIKVDTTLNEIADIVVEAI